ncbi:MAG: DNA methyltransferase [Pyrinomonadaceae bacterium]
MPIDPKEELKALLRELFQLDKTDLDFGIYRIMNMRSKDVEDFIDNTLPAALLEVTSKLAGRGKEAAKADLAEARSALVEHIKNNGEEAETNEHLTIFCAKHENAPVVKAYRRAKEEAAQATHSKEVETAIYNDLYTFFNRYYEEGDFISKPRAGEHTYMIPYNGEEVKFHWANRDQYYIKTGENFRNYVFNNGETDETRKTTVEFRLMDAETATNNNQNKKGRIFIPAEDWFHWDGEGRKLEIHFEYKVPSAEEKETWGDKQSVKKDNKGINEQLITEHLDGKIRETEDAFLIRFWESEKTVKIKGKDENVGTFYYHLNRYTATNSFDYFIHKDLRRFLLQELDYYLKHDIFTLNFVDAQISEDEQNTAIRENVLRATAIRLIAGEIIEFLAELENFQKMLFEKKKFVVQSDYCITLDLIPEDLIDEVIEFVLSDPEKRQLLEWQTLGFIEEIDLAAERIKADKYLVLDTQLLLPDLKFKVLGGLEELDEKTGGIMVNSDNFQCLRIFESRFRKRINCIYIDPPYNTDAAPILYKNNYRDSSWLALLKDRLSFVSNLLADDGVLSVAIDDYELANLVKLLEVTLPTFKIQKVIVNHYPGSGTGRSNVSRTHEYNIFVIPNDEDLLRGKLEKPREKMRERGFRRAGTGENNYRIGRENSFFAILVNPMTLEIKGLEPPPPLNEKNYPRGATGGWTRVYPIGEDNSERVWSLSYENAKKALKRELLYCSKNFAIVRKYPNSKDRNLLESVWLNKRFNATTHGTNLLTNIFGKSGLFPYPKSVYTVSTAIDSVIFDNNKAFVLDFFAGSGTTGHAVVHLNREDMEDDACRRFLLAETGEYFESVTKVRIQKIIYSEKWSEGKPTREELNGGRLSSGISHIFQYLKLEQYEDSLNNIEFENKDAPAAFSFADQIKYTLRKGTKASTSLMNIAKFADPFNYEMDILKLNERVPTKIDLVTTFNFLLGIDVSRYRVFQHQDRDYHVVHGKKGNGEYICIWRKHDPELDLKVERDWIKKQDWYSDEGATVYCNSDNAFGAHGIEAEFQKLMFEDVDY